LNTEELHQQAINYAKEAVEASEKGYHKAAFSLFQQAAGLESQIAEYYLDKEDAPSRSEAIVNAALMNLKAGLVEYSKKYICFGLLNISDPKTIQELNNALESAVSMKYETAEEISREFNYLNLLRRRSIHYVIEPITFSYGNSVNLEVIKDFSDSYLKSLRSFIVAKYRLQRNRKGELERTMIKNLEQLVKPLVTSVAYGGFQFSIANDFLSREGEEDEVRELKASVVTDYHNEILINPLSDQDIDQIKKTYSSEEVEAIFRPLTKIRSHNAAYRIGYHDLKDFAKKFPDQIVNSQRLRLLPPKQVNQDDIGELENLIIHKRSSQTGKIFKKTIHKTEFKSYEFDISLREVVSKDQAILTLKEEIVISVIFNSDTGFQFSFDDAKVSCTDLDYGKGLTHFSALLYDKIMDLYQVEDKTTAQQKEWKRLKKMINEKDLIS